jgi:hypothetical protein
VFIPGIPLLKVWLICDSEADDANTIESSVVGGTKIGEAMARVVREYEFGRRRTEVYINHHIRSEEGSQG